jgi:hypothetical protein
MHLSGVDSVWSPWNSFWPCRNGILIEDSISLSDASRSTSSGSFTTVQGPVSLYKHALVCSVHTAMKKSVKTPNLTRKKKCNTNITRVEQPQPYLGTNWAMQTGHRWPPISLIPFIDAVGKPDHPRIDFGGVLRLLWTSTAEPSANLD